MKHCPCSIKRKRGNNPFLYWTFMLADCFKAEKHRKLSLADNYNDEPFCVSKSANDQGAFKRFQMVNNGLKVVPSSTSD